MSKIEVNTVEPQCGTTLTLGACGQTVALGSGASQTGFGRTGTVDWQTSSIKTALFTAANGEGYFCNTSGGAFTVNLPGGVAGNIVAFADYTRSFGTYNLTISPNGAEKIGGIAGDGVLSTNGQSATFVYVDGTEGWVNINETQTSQTGTTGYIMATGGTESTCGNDKIHKFTGPGTFCVSAISPTPACNQVSYLVVAGGGGGGSSWRSGGGGAGGFREDESPTTPYTASPLEGAGSISVTATSFPITVGGGGTSGGPSLACKGTQGNESVFSTKTATGGGLGGEYNPGCSADTLGSPGGSGGGGGGDNSGPSVAGNGNDPSTSPAQGTNGGNGCGSGSYSSGGGGGGATVAGSATYSPAPSNVGGTGATTSISGSPTAYAGGGGGGSYVTIGSTAPAGGTGGGGQGGTESSPSTYPALGTPAGPHSGTVNTGGGGGGKAGTSSAVLSGAGGSGIVIIRYKFQ
jgi:hypothetical protein